MPTPDPSAEMLAEMAQCAYRLGVAFGAEAERAETHERRMEGERAEAPDPCDADPDRDPAYTEADRDRDREPVSVPAFLNTLRDVAASASARPGPAPDALSTLRGLLDQVPASPVAKTPSPPARTSAAALRSRLAGATALLAPAKLALPTGLRGAPLRRATGPPPRR